MGAIWTSFDGLLISRIVQGGSVAAFESVAISMIGDLYFVHERGFYMALMQFLLGATSNFTAVIAGPITAELGWEWLFYLLVSELPNRPRLGLTGTDSIHRRRAGAPVFLRSGDAVQQREARGGG